MLFSKENEYSFWLFSAKTTRLLYCTDFYFSKIITTQEDFCQLMTELGASKDVLDSGLNAQSVSLKPGDE